MMPMMEENILKYDTGPEFLKHYYLSRKKSNKKFSYETWAREIKYPHRSNLRLVVSGARKISPVLEGCISKKILKNQREKQYFKLLCQIDRAQNETQRKAFQSRAQLIKSQKETTISNQEENHKHILEMVYLYTILGFSDLQRTAKNLGRLFKKDESEIEKSLQMLKSKNAVETTASEDGETQWLAKSEYSILQDDFQNEALAEFHKKSFLKAIASQKLEKEKRRFDSLILALDPDEYGQFNKELQEFLDLQFYKYNTKKLKNKTLYQVQIGSFPAI
jgi:uncharacterized protein (TIGR02147 family)